MDKDFNAVWSNDVTLPYIEELFRTTDYVLDNEGNVFILGKHYNQKPRTFSREESDYSYSILMYTADNNDELEHEVKSDAYFLRDMLLSVGDNDQLICAGFYSQNGKTSIDGTYYLLLDKVSGAVSHESYKEFSLNFITQYMSDRQEKKAKKKESKGKNQELYEYDLKSLVRRADGGSVLIGEQFFIQVSESTTTSANGVTSTRTTYRYFYNDIIVINVSPEGEIEWMEKIRKEQTSVNDNGFYASFALMVKDDKMYFIFNDHPNNLYYKGDGKFYRFIPNKESLAVIVEVDADGNQQREALFSSDEAETIIRPKVCDQYSETQMVLFGQQRKKQRFARLDFK